LPVVRHVHQLRAPGARRRRELLAGQRRRHAAGGVLPGLHPLGAVLRRAGAAPVHRVPGAGADAAGDRLPFPDAAALGGRAGADDLGLTVGGLRSAGTRGAGPAAVPADEKPSTINQTFFHGGEAMATRSERCGRVAALVLAAVVLGLGCNPLSIAY